MANKNVPKATLQRYPVYLKALRKLANSGVERIMSKELSNVVSIEPHWFRFTLAKLPSVSDPFSCDYITRCLMHTHSFIPYIFQFSNH